MPKKLEDNQIEGVQRLLSLLNPNTLTKEDFTKNFKKVIDHVGEMKKKNVDDFKGISKALTDSFKEAKNTSNSDFKSLKDSINTLSKKSLTELNNTFTKKIEELDKGISSIKNGKDADEEKIVGKVVELIKIPTIEELKNDLPVMGVQVRNALEVLPDGEEDTEDKRLGMSSISGLEEELKELSKRIKSLTQTQNAGIYQQGSSSSGGKTVTAIDLSADLNGSKRVFAIHTVWRVITVHLTSSPTIMREGIDYTWTPTSITFTSEVSDNALSSGQSLLIVAAE